MRKKAVGFKDCCRDSGWGGNLAKCSESEEALGKAKEKKA
ncbi:conjugal transfer protein TraN [Vibrio sinaloensis]|nr:conjugal transfer protein TraN [Vibrio sinaloensis]